MPISTTIGYVIRRGCDRQGKIPPAKIRVTCQRIFNGQTILTCRKTCCQSVTSSTGTGNGSFEWRDCWYCLGLHHIVLSRLRWWFGFIRWLFCVTWQGSLDFVVDCDLWEYRLIVSNHVIRHRAALKSLSILVEVCYEVCSFGVFLVDNQVSGSSMMGTIGFKISLHTLIRF